MSYDQYSAAYADARTKYGAKTVVWMEVGTFFEMYGIKVPRRHPTSSEELDVSEDTMRHVCGLLDIILTKKNKSNPDSDTKNPFMAGFPSFMLEKYIAMLVDEGYTIVIMEQQKTRVKSTRTGKESANIYRTVTRVVSPGTYIGDAMSPADNSGSGERFLLAMRLERLVLSNASTYVYGLACIDITTGHTIMHEHTNLDRESKFDTRMLKEDLYRVLLFFGPPKEVYIFTDDRRTADARGDSKHDLASIVEYIGSVCGSKTLVHHHSADAKAAQMHRLFCKPDYQDTMFRKVWKDACSRSMLSPIELFGLERSPLAASALCALMQFVYDHGDHLIRSVRPPEWWDRVAIGDSITPLVHRSLVLNYTSASQLDIADTGDSGSPGFIGMFNKCQTTMGKRLFRSRVLCPSCDADELGRIYDITDGILASGSCKEIGHDLSRLVLPDMERLTRKLCMGRVSTAELCRLGRAVQDSLSLLGKYASVHDAFGLQASEDACLRRMADRVNTVLNMDADVGIPDIRPGVDARIDKLDAVITACIAACKDVAESANAAAGHIFPHTQQATEYYKLECGDRDGFYLTVTQKRHAEICKECKAAELSPLTAEVRPDTLERVPGSSSVSSSLKLTNAVIKDANLQIISARAEQQELKNRIFQELVANLGECRDTEEALRALATKVAGLDFHCCVARHAASYGWTRPVIAPDQGGAWVRAQALRHPIIEQVLSATGMHAYVPNDVALGHGQPHNGMLLYGINASGKSSLMKSIGIAVVMAQAGMHVPACRFEFTPYREVFTRIVSVDNLYAGRSTFTNEIMELRNIMRRASAYSLVLGDELCSGTESISAMSIVGAGIKRLAGQRCTYMFATHLHELTRMGILDDVERLRVCHLAVTFSAELDSLVYDRVLKDGPGDALYGLEVCRSLDLDEDFMQAATSIRKQITGAGELLVGAKQSRYSCHVFMDLCELCGKGMAQETHHLVPQALADARGLLEGRYHKNARWNLMCLCSTCHDRIHANDHPVQSSPTGGNIKRVMTTRGAKVLFAS